MASAISLAKKREIIHQNDQKLFYKTLKMSPNQDNLIATTDCYSQTATDDEFAGSQIHLLDRELMLVSSFSFGCSTVYDLDWFPNDMEKCYVMSRKDAPVQIRSSVDGLLRCSYSVFDDKECLLSPLSVKFSPTGDRIACGCDGGIRIFNTIIPGRAPSMLFSFKQSQSNVKQHTGVVSSLEYSPVNPPVVFAGTFHNVIGMFDGRAGERPQQLFLSPTGSGISQIRMLNEDFMLVASRRDDWIHAWDLRSKEIVFSLERPGSLNNQRLFFDTFLARNNAGVSNHFLTSGDMRGNLWLFNLSSLDIPPIIAEISSNTCFSVPAVISSVSQGDSGDDCEERISINACIGCRSNDDNQGKIPFVAEFNVKIS